MERNYTAHPKSFSSSFLLFSGLAHCHCFIMASLIASQFADCCAIQKGRIRLLLLVILANCLIGFYGYGQVINSESFDGTTFPPALWTMSGSNPTFLFRTTSGLNPTQAPHSGAGEVEFNSFNLASGTEELITPVIDWTGRGAGTPTVSFWFYRDKTAYNTTAYNGEGVNVYVNTTTSLTGATLLGFVPRRGGQAPPATTGWHQYSYNIPASYSTCTNYIIFDFVSKYGDNCFMDDVSYVSYPTSACNCTVPTAQPTSLTFPNISSTFIAGSFTAASPTCDGYLVVQTTSSTAPSNPVNGTAYTVGSAALGGTIVASGTATTFTATGLAQATPYWYWVYAMNYLCGGTSPEYYTTSPLSGTATTKTGKNWIGIGAGGAGTDFNTAANWSPAAVPGPTDEAIITTTAGVTAIITLSANTTVGALTISDNGSPTMALDAQTHILTVNNDLNADEVVGGGGVVSLRVGTGSIIVAGNTYLGTNGNTADFVEFNGSGGVSSTGTITFKGNVTFGDTYYPTGTNTIGKLIWDGTGAQTIYTNNSYNPLLNANCQIGSANTPTVTVSTAYSNVLQTYDASMGLTINAGATLDLSTTTWNQQATTPTGTFVNNGTLRLAANTGGQTGSNFPLNYSTNTLAATSTVEYYGTVAQTIFATPAYGNLTLAGSGTKTLANAGNTTINNVLTINTGIILKLNTNTSYTLTLNGTIAGAGTITGGTASNITIGGTGTFGTLTPTTAPLVLANFIINRGGLGSITLGGNMTTQTSCNFTNGALVLNGHLLTLNGTLALPVSSTNGMITGSATSNISIGASSITNSLWMDQTTPGTTNSVTNFTLNSTGQTLTLGNPLNLIGKLTPTAGTFASAGNLTLVASSPTVTAWIGPIGGSVTGNVTVQSYEAGGKTGWCLMGEPGVNATNTFQQWNSAFQITCSTCPNGCCPGGSAFTSIYSYLETTGGTFSNTARYVPIANITDATTMGQGYWVYLGNGQNTTTDIKISTTGPVNQGNFVYNITYSPIAPGAPATDWGYNLIANPYPAPISWSSLRAGNASVANAIYVYNPDLSGYASYVNGVSSPAVGSGGIGNMIAAGQGFYIKASAATTLTAKESYKAASTQQLLRTSTPNQTDSLVPPTMVFRLIASNSTMKNETAIYFDANATNNYDIEYDALSLGVDAGYLGITSVWHDTVYAINGLPALTGNLSVPIKVITGTTGSYQITATDIANLPSAACIKLHDNYTSTDWDLRTGAYNCTLTDTETVARFVLNILLPPTCSASGIKTIVSNENMMQINRDAAGYYVQFNYPSKTNALISVQNLLGEKVVADINLENVLSNKTYIPLGNTTNNVLIIMVITDAGEKTYRKVVNQ